MQYPSIPFRIDDATPICERVRIMQDLSAQGSSDPKVRAMASVIATRAAAKCADFEKGATDPETRQVLTTQDWRRRLLALETLRAVQSLPYVKDPVDEEWMQCSAWTIDHGGDCKDSSVLLSSLARALGMRAEPYWVTQTGQQINHVTGRVWIEGQPLWADGSIRGAMLGESPYEAEPRLESGVTGMTFPAGRGKIPFNPGRHVFGWHGWDSLWAGWPAWWWCSRYPYLCLSYPTVVAYPVQSGFYANPLIP